MGGSVNDEFTRVTGSVTIQTHKNWKVQKPSKRPMLLRCSSKRLSSPQTRIR